MSHINLTGIPCVPKKPSSFGMILPAAVDLTISTSRNRLYVSMTDRKYSPEGTGPKKSALTVCHGVGGKNVDCIGSLMFSCPVA